MPILESVTTFSYSKLKTKIELRRFAPQKFQRKNPTKR
ncbi:hypothetical protein APA_3029 [Pseudanabaena sp. lw0831]|nr:hypothetical protein APA_3029 [Pseudanabaena sp. lw0831]